MEWEEDAFAELVEQARDFQRVGGAAIPAPEAFLQAVVSGLFGVRADGEGGRFELAPWLPEGWRKLALRRLRLHRTVVDVEVRPRAEWATVRLEVSFGPAIPLAVSLRHADPIARITVDDVVLAGPRAIFTLAGQHEVIFFFGESS